MSENKIDTYRNALADLRAAKQECERRIGDAIAKELAEFTAATGAVISSLSIDVKTMSGPSKDGRRVVPLRSAPVNVSAEIAM